MTNQEIKNIEKKKRSLKRYKKNKACIERLEEKLLTLNERIQSARSPTLSGTPHGGIPVTTADLIADKEDLTYRIARLKDKGRTLKIEILEEIDTLEDYRYCEILEGFFIECRTLEEIADSEGYTLRHVYRLYSEAVTRLALDHQ